MLVLAIILTFALAMWSAIVSCFCFSVTYRFIRGATQRFTSGLLLSVAIAGTSFQVFILLRFPGIWADGQPLAILTIATPPAVLVGLVVHLLRNRRPQPGQCECGYDLTGDVSGRCPECGTEI